MVLRAIAEQVSAAPLRQWLLEQLPGPNDVEELGYGAWFRSSDQTIIVRSIDLRLMTAENQRLICDAGWSCILTARWFPAIEGGRRSKRG
jgi:hypothetical protein